MTKSPGKRVKMAGPLAGLRVLDLTRLAPGPFCTMVLGDLGAEVVRIDQPGEPEWKPPGASLESPFNALARNKRSVGLNLKSKEGRQIFLELVKGADVVVEGFRPGVMDRLKIGWRVLRRLNPRLILCSITGYGQTGPYRMMAGHDLNYIGFGGLLGIMGPEGGRPAIPHNVVADFAGGGLHGALAILAAVVGREKTGRGRFIDISMTDCVVSLQAFLLGEYFETGSVPRPGRTLLDGGAPFYNVYETKDGKWLTVAALEPRFFANLCRTLGMEEWAARQHDRSAWAGMRSKMERIFRRRTRDDWFNRLGEQDACVGKVLGYEELAGDPQLRERRMFTPSRGALRVGVGVGVRRKATGRVPKRFGDTGAVLRELGYTSRRVMVLRESGAVA